jgi:hypothetical protein
MCVILFKTGMLNASRNGARWHNPVTRLEGFYNGIIWPASIGRLPPSVHFSRTGFKYTSHCYKQIARGAGSVKADQWCSQLHILFVGLFVVWEVDGEIPNEHAPLSAPNTKNAIAQAQLEKLLQERHLASLLVKKPNASQGEITRVKTATMSRSLVSHYETVVVFSAAVRILSSRSISPNEVQCGCAALSRSCQLWV